MDKDRKINVIKLTDEDLRQRLDEYETRFGMASDVFYRKYNQGVLGCE